MDHTAFTLQSHHTHLSPRKHSPDGGTMASGSNHLIAAYYSFIDPECWAYVQTLVINGALIQKVS